MSEPVSKLICAISSLADIDFTTTTVACDSKRTFPIGPPSNSIYASFKFIFAHEIIRQSPAAFSSGE